MSYGCKTQERMTILYETFISSEKCLSDVFGSPGDPIMISADLVDQASRCAQQPVMLHAMSHTL
jgi:hypothetical protein